MRNSKRLPSLDERVELLKKMFGDQTLYFPRGISFDDSKVAEYEKILHKYIIAWWLFYAERFSEAIDYFRCFESNIEDVSPHGFKVKNSQFHLVVNKSKFYELKGSIYSTKSNLATDAYEAFKLHHLHQVKVVESEAYAMPFYTFRSVNEYSYADIINKTITVVNPRLMNDPSDTLLFDWMDFRHVRNKSSLLKEANEMFREAAKYYRIRSFVGKEENSQYEPFQNTLMWAHYADCHKGICIKYKLSTLFQENRSKTSFSRMQKIIYKDVPIDLTDKDGINGEMALTYKAEDWVYENEYRLLTYNISKEGPFVSIPLDKDSSIEAIYFGIRCPQETKNAIKALFKRKKNRPLFYEMQKDPKDIYRLKAVVV